MSVAEIWALKIARIRGVLRRHEKKPGMANVAAIGRCLGGLRWGGEVWGLLPVASAFAVPGAAKVPANIWFFIADFSEHWEWSIGDCGEVLQCSLDALVLREGNPGHYPLTLVLTLLRVSSFPSGKTKSSAHTNQSHGGTRRFCG